MSLNNAYQSGDWKGEKHVPVIHAPESIKSGEEVEIRISIGDGEAHPNTFEHYISWMKIYFQPEGHNFPIEIGTYDFAAHGESEIFTEPNVTARFTAKKSGTITATSYCNIHGLWENTAELKVD